MRTISSTSDHSGCQLNEFIRPFTEEEFDQRFQESCYPEMARQFCREFYEGIFNETLDINEPELSKTSISQLIEDLKSGDGWTADTVREEAWNHLLRTDLIAVYVAQRQHGNSHEWSAKYANLSYNYDMDKELSDIYHDTNRELMRISPRHADSELSIAVKFWAKGQGELVETFIKSRILDSDGKKKNMNDLYAESLRFKKICEELIAEGQNTEMAIKHAENLYFAESAIYEKAYRSAMTQGSNPAEAHALADFCDEAFINGYILLEEKKFKSKFTEEWQRELYCQLILDDMKKSGEILSTARENEIRQLMGLLPIDK